MEIEEALIIFGDESEEQLAKKRGLMRLLDIKGITTEKYGKGIQFVEAVKRTIEDTEDGWSTKDDDIGLTISLDTMLSEEPHHSEDVNTIKAEFKELLKSKGILRDYYTSFEEYRQAVSDLLHKLFESE